MLRWYVRVSLAALSPGLALQASTIDRDLGLVPPTESPIAACMVAISFAVFDGRRLIAQAGEARGSLGLPGANVKVQAPERASALALGWLPAPR